MYVRVTLLCWTQCWVQQLTFWSGQNLTYVCTSLSSLLNTMLGANPATIYAIYIYSSILNTMLGAIIDIWVMTKSYLFIVRGFFVVGNFAVGQFTVRKCQFRLGQVGQIRLSSVRFFFSCGELSYGEVSYGEKSQSLYVCMSSSLLNIFS